MTSAADYHAAEREILSRLDLRAEVIAIAVRLAGDGDDWVPCFGVGREDNSPSASFNVRHGHYLDRGVPGKDKHISFWDLCVLAGAFATWQAARDHYAAKVGVALPGKSRSRNGKPVDEIEKQLLAQIAFDNTSFPAWSTSLADAKPPISAESLRRANAKSCRWPKGRHSLECIALPCYRLQDLAGVAAVILLRANGTPFPAVAKLAERKAHLLRGSKSDGVLIGGSRDQYQAATTLVLVEGPSDCLALMPLLPEGWIAITLPCGAGSFPEAVAKSLAATGKPIYVSRDADQPGEAGTALACRRLIEANAAEVFRVTLPYPIAMKHGRDLRDWIRDGGRFEQFQSLCQRVTAADVNAKTADSDPRTRIVIDTDEHRVIDQVVAAVAGDQELYQRGGVLVREIVDDTEGLPACISQPSGGPRIVEVPVARVRTIITRCCRVVREAKTETGTADEPAHPPDWLVRGVHAAGRLPGVRHLVAVVESPTLRPDGSIFQDAGYDPTTGILFEPPCKFPPVPENPSRDDAIAAAARLLDVVCDFPFARPCNRSAWLAQTLSPIARFAYSGPTPGFVTDGNLPGVGKGLLNDSSALIATGREPAKLVFPNDENEAAKLVLAVALSGERMVAFDNVKRAIGGAALEAALTATFWQGRILGRSETARVPLTAIWTITGNNASIHGDMGRRICHIRLETSSEHPEDRVGFKHKYLSSYVKGIRQQLLIDALTILRAYFVAGRPDLELTPWGSYEGWSSIVRNAIVWVGLPDPADTRIELRDECDSELEALKGLIRGWEHLDIDRSGVSASEAIDRLFGAGYLSESLQSLRAVVAEHCGRRGNPKPTAKDLGWRLRSFRKRVVDGRYFDRELDGNDVALWSVRCVQSRAPESSSPASLSGFTGDTGDTRDDFIPSRGESFESNIKSIGDSNGTHADGLKASLPSPVSRKLGAAACSHHFDHEVLPDRGLVYHCLWCGALPADVEEAPAC